MFDFEDKQKIRYYESSDINRSFCVVFPHSIKQFERKLLLLLQQIANQLKYYAESCISLLLCLG